MLSLISSARIRRLMDDELLMPDKAYTVTELLNEVQDGIFSELNADKPKIDMLRRGLQRAYLEHLKSELLPKEEAVTKGGDSGSTDFRAVARVSVRRLQNQVNTSLTRTKDGITMAHLEDCKREIEAMLGAGTPHRDTFSPSVPSVSTAPKK